MKRLEVNNLNYSYKDDKVSTRVLTDISFSLDEGKTIAIIGESGCGKTTLLKIIAGIIDTDADITYNGMNLNNIPVKDRNMSYVSQSFSMYPIYNVYNNIALPLKAEKIDYNEIDNRVKEMASLFHLIPFLTRKDKQLSLGQQKKVALSRSFIKYSDLYLLDEPFSNLDQESRFEIRNIINSFKTRYNATMIIVTHDFNDCLSLADEVLVMDKGMIIERGTALDLYNNSVNEETRKLIASGAMKDE